MADLVLTAILKSDPSNMISGLLRANDSMTGLGATAALTFAGLATAAIVGGIAATKMAGDFQSGMTTLVNAAGEAQQNIGMVSDGILKLAVDTGTSTQALTDAMFMVESANFRGAEGLHVLEAAAKGAAVGHAELGIAGQALTTVMTDYHLSADKATSTMNAMLAASASGKMELQDLATSMGAILPIASSLGISFPQIGGAMSVMTNAGMSAQQSAENLANTLRSLSAPNAVAVKALTSVGLTAQQLKDTLSEQGLTGAIKLIEEHIGSTFPTGSVASVDAFKDIMGGATGLNTALMLGGKSMETFEANVSSIADALNAGNGAITGWAKVQEDFNFRMSQAREVVEVLMIKIGLGLLPVLTQIANVVVPIMSAFADWATSGHAVADIMAFISQHAQIMVPALAGVGAIVGGLLVMAFISLAGAAGSAAVSVIAATWPLLLLGAAVAGVAAIFVNFYQNSAPFKAFIDQLVANIAQASTGFLGWVTSGRALHDVMLIMQPVIAYLSPLVMQLGSAILDLAKAVAPLLLNLGIVLGYFGQWAVNSGILNIAVTSLVIYIGLFTQGLTLLIIGLTNVIVFLSTSGSNAQFLWSIFAGIGAFLASVFVPLWQQLVTVFQTQVAPAFAQLIPAIGQLFAAFQALTPIFQALGIVVGVILVVAFGLLVGVISAVIAGIVGFISGLAQALGGIIQIISGVLQIIIGLVTFFIDLFTGNWGKLAADLGTIWQGVVTMFAGIWNTIAGIFMAAVGLLLGIISGFITGVVGFFVNMWHMLVGGSIVPDMINGIVGWFGQLPGRVGAFIMSLISGVLGNFASFSVQAIGHAIGLVNGYIGALGGLIGRGVGVINSAISSMLGALNGAIGSAINAGWGIVNGIAQGIRNGIGMVAGAIGSVVAYIADHLPHSPAKVGPLKDLPLQGARITEQIGQGMIAGLPKLQSALTQIMTPITDYPYPHYANSQKTPVIHVHVHNDQPTPIYLDGQELTNALVPLIAGGIRMHGGVRTL